MIQESVKLAWAAGFFDGEGSTSLTKSGAMILTIYQKDREVLDGFEIATGQGKVYGPYHAPSNHGQPHFQYHLYGKEAVSRILDMLWPYLGTLKMDQAIKCGYSPARMVQ